MDVYQKITLVSMRIALGFLMLYAGVSKLFDPNWSPFGYLARAKTFPELYAIFLDSSVIAYTTFLNEWGLTLIGAALIVGFGTRIASVCGAVLMGLYYFPVLAFPYVGEHAFIVDDHIIYAIAFVVLISFRTGEVWSLTQILLKHISFARIPIVKKLIV